MSKARFVFAGLMAAVGSTLGGTMTRADDAWIDFTTFLRAGPGVHYRAIDEAPSDERVDVLACENGWCRIVYGSGSGFVSQAALRATAPPPPRAGEPCFVNRIAGYHGGPETRICAAAPAQ